MDNQKRDRIIYVVSTGIVGAVMLVSALYFSLSVAMREGFAHLGLPGWFRTELSIAKLLGAAALLMPRVPDGVREFAYAGFAITISSACVAHMSSGDGFFRSLEPLVFLGLLIVSFVYRRRLMRARHG